jgi:hypothetical protein
MWSERERCMPRTGAREGVQIAEKRSEGQDYCAVVIAKGQTPDAQGELDLAICGRGSSGRRVD